MGASVSAPWTVAPTRGQERADQPSGAAALPTTVTELRWLYDRRDGTEARQHLDAWLERWAAKYPKLTTWVEAQIEETFTFYRLPQSHHKHLKSTNLLERFHQELKRRSLVVRIFPNEGSCLRLIRALAAEQHEEWLDGARYFDMQPLADLTKTQLQLAA